MVNTLKCYHECVENAMYRGFSAFVRQLAINANIKMHKHSRKMPMADSRAIRKLALIFENANQRSNLVGFICQSNHLG